MCEQLVRRLRFLATAEDATGMADSAMAMREAAAELERLRKDAERLEWLHSHVRLLTKNWDWVGLVGFRQAIDVQMRLTEKEVNRVAAMQERQS